MQKVIDYLSSHNEQSIEQLKDLVRFASVSAQPEKYGRETLACADWLVRHCTDIGLETVLHQTSGNPIIVARVPRERVANPDSAPTILLYGHYDVQPPEPFELWETPPFEPTIRNNNLFARGAADNKGQHFAHLKAIEAYIRTGTPLPCHITFLIEGEEEVGSGSLYSFIEEHADSLKADFLFISDNGIPGLEHPTVTYALRGVSAMEVELTGPDRDLHSGFFGGAVANPAMELCRLMAKIHDDHGRIRIPGFYDRVRELTSEERESFRMLPETDESVKNLTGVPELYGEDGFTTYERRTSRPTVEINGMTSGYQGSGSKTIVPSKASAKITMRLVPDQDPTEALDQLEQFLKDQCPPTVRIKITRGHAGEPYLTSPDGPFATAARTAVEKAFGHPALIAREGGSIPIINEFRNCLGIDTLLPGLSLPDDNMHSPNEKFSLECFEKGKVMSAWLFHEIGVQVAGSRD
jgi:acetylornithine deacetylase/succinyl-diaminopimelate desuccinylase-like protein